MTIQRRSFIKNSSLIAGGLMFMDPFQNLNRLSTRSATLHKAINTVSIFHTNDLHNQIAPLVSGNLQGYGGLKNVETILEKRNIASVLLDAGDFLDDRATPEQHECMIRQMNRMGYNAATIGNRELALGQEYLAQLAGLMRFRLVNCNYGFSNAVLQTKVVPYHLINWGPYKIGITGVGTVLNRRLAHSEHIIFHHPYHRANTVAAYLKQHCDLVICLSHLGYGTNKTGYNNHDLALASENIDIIVSGHDKDLVAAPKVVRNKEKKEVILSHGGWRGLIGRHLMVSFNERGEKNFIECRNYVPSQKVEEPFYTGFDKIRAVG